MLPRFSHQNMSTFKVQSSIDYLKKNVACLEEYFKKLLIATDFNDKVIKGFYEFLCLFFDDDEAEVLLLEVFRGCTVHFDRSVYRAKGVACGPRIIERKTFNLIIKQLKVLMSNKECDKSSVEKV